MPSVNQTWLEDPRTQWRLLETLTTSGTCSVKFNISDISPSPHHRCPAPSGCCFSDSWVQSRCSPEALILATSSRLSPGEGTLCFSVGKMGHGKRWGIPWDLGVGIDGEISIQNSGRYGDSPQLPLYTLYIDQLDLRFDVANPKINHTPFVR